MMDFEKISKAIQEIVNAIKRIWNELTSLFERIEQYNVIKENKKLKKNLPHQLSPLKSQVMIRIPMFSRIRNSC